MSKFNIFTIDSRVILSIIGATGVYALLLKFLQKNSPHNVQTKWGGGAKGFLNNVKKDCTFDNCLITGAILILDGLFCDVYIKSHPSIYFPFLR